MKKIFILSFFLVAAAIAGHAQNHALTGVITDDSNHTALKGANVTLTSINNPSVKFGVIADGKGQFVISNVPDGTYLLDVNSLGYATTDQTVIMNGQDQDYGTVSLDKQKNELTDIVVVSEPPPVQQKDDTIQYNANKYKTNPDATAQDLIQKMPGISVDNTGTVTAHGDQVKSVTVDGKKFFGDDATAALQNLPADVIDKIQVFDKLSDQAQFTGFDDGNSVRAINIVTKANMRTGQFGRMFAGYGSDNRYLAGGNINFFKGDRRISVVGLFNNVNQQNFSSQDLLGFSSTSGGGGRGGRASGVPTVGPQNGITATNAIGINYDDMWGKKLEVQASYFFNNGDVHNFDTSRTEYFLPDSTNQFYNQGSTSDTKNYNHRLNLRFDYKIDSANLITFTPVLSFQNNSATNMLNGTSLTAETGGDSINNVHSFTNATGNGYNLNNNLLYRHAFKKKGRTISLNLNGTFNKNNGDTYLQSFNRYYTTLGVDSLNDTLQEYTGKRTNGYQLSANIAYTEPIGKGAQLQLNYSPSYTRNKANTGTYLFNDITNAYSTFDTSLSNNFDNTVTSQSAGATFRIGNKDNFLAAGVAYQYTVLNSQELFPVNPAPVNRLFNDVLPNLMWRKKLSAKSNLRIFYRAALVAPSVTQLQNVINNTNPLFVTAGNIYLNQEYGNTLAARYTFTNVDKGTSFFANIYLQQYNNYIGSASYIATKDSVLNSSVTLFKGSQLTKPVNLDGYVSARSFFTYGMPIKFIKSTINLNAGFSLARTPSIINNISNISNNYGYSTGLVIASNISKYVDFTVSYNANYNVVDNSIEPQLNTNYLAQNADIKFNLLTKKGWFAQSDISNQSYSGLTGGFNQSYWLWNASAGRKFLSNQRGELKLSVFDLLDQNKSITRTVAETYIKDDQNLVLQQYFMLSFTYTLKSFGNVPTSKGDDGGPRGERPPGGGPGYGRPPGGGPYGPGGSSF